MRKLLRFPTTLSVVIVTSVSCAPATTSNDASTLVDAVAADVEMDPPECIRPPALHDGAVLYCPDDATPCYVGTLPNDGGLDRLC